MGRFIKGDIVVINFPFSDFSGAKRRPALVVACTDDNELILCQITSRAKNDKYTIAINTEDFTGGRLKAESFIRPNKIFTVDHHVVQYMACKINSGKVDDIIDAITEIIRN